MDRSIRTFEELIEKEHGKRGNNSATISTVLKVFHAMNAKVKFKIEIEESAQLILPITN